MAGLGHCSREVLSPLLFNLLVDGLAAEVQLACAGFHLPGNVQCWFTDQLCADDLVLVADSPLDLQSALNAVHRWGCRLRFKFGVGPTKSAVMVFGNRRRLPDFDLHQGGVSLAVVSSYKYLGALLTPTLSWTKHVQFLISRGNRLFAQCVAWCRAEHVPVQMASSIFRVNVLPSVSWGSEFFAQSPAALHLLDGAIRRWGRHVLGRPPGSPCAVLCELGWPDAEHLAMGRLLSLLGRSFSLARGLGCPLPATVLSVASQTPGTWAHHALAMCAYLDIPSPLAAGIHLQSPPHRVRRWVDLVVSPSLNLALHQRLQASIHSLSTTRLPDGAPFSVNAGPDVFVYGRGSSPGLPESCRFCDASVGGSVALLV